MKRTKNRILLALFIVLLPICIMAFSNYTIEQFAKDKTFTQTHKIKHNKVGLVLGTTKLLKGGYVNLYFTYRIRATVELFKAGKIDFVLISGDNSSKNYDEPTDFKNELIKKGIPASKIFLDFAGFRTLDSIIRAKEIFDQTEITVISQEFHNKRAIYLAEKNGISAVGYNSKDVSNRYGIKVKIREYFARTKVFLDIVFGVGPKFLGPKVEIK